MRNLKMVLKLLSVISLVVLAVTGNALAALPLLISASMHLGIMVGEKKAGKSISERL